MIHTDLKPENICLLDARHENSTCCSEQLQNLDIKLIDFGTAFWFYEKRVQTIQTRQYRAPEVILECGQWDFKVDTWSIGCILYELMTGRLLFHVDEQPFQKGTHHMANIHQVILL